MIDCIDLHIDNISCTRNNCELFTPVHFILKPGQIMHIKGPNGIGKTTLLRCIAGFIAPASGQILWSQLPITEQDDYQSKLGFLGHKLAIKSSLSVYENLTMSPSLLIPPTATQIEQALTRLELSSLRLRLASTLSSGQRQRLAVARLSLSNSAVWIMDEPFNSLDSRGVELLQQLIGQHLANSGMVIFTAHQSCLLQTESYQSLELTCSAFSQVNIEV